MNRRVMRAVAGANIFAGCILLQGCGIFNSGTPQSGVSEIPEDLPPVEVQPVDMVGDPIGAPTVVATAPVVPSSIELPVIQATTPYTIKKGDTISSVAYRYGLRWQDVVAINPGVAPTKLRVGQVIQLPGSVNLGSARPVPTVAPKAAPKAAVKPASIAAPKTTTTAVAFDSVYVVKSGDSLSVIAARHNITTATLREANGIKGDKILVGQKLKVPGGAKATPKPPTVVAPKATAPKLTAPATTKPVVAPAAPVKVESATPPVVEKAVETPVKDEPVTEVQDTGAHTYTVKDNEDIYAVAIRWGVSPSDLKELNNLSSSDLKPGTVLRIPKSVE